MKKYGGLIRLFDIILAFVLLPAAIMFFMLILLPQLFCFGKLFYKSIRVGQYGKKFQHIKLRSMKENSETAIPAGGRAHLEKWRIPAWGRFLRATHLDELPEIIFILAGRESFVGPRPLLPEHMALVNSLERLSLKPGWTGYSQIFLKTRRILPSRIQRRLDCKLAKELNPAVYIKILLATFFLPKRKAANPGKTVISYRQSIQNAGNRLSVQNECGKSDET